MKRYCIIASLVIMASMMSCMNVLESSIYPNQTYAELSSDDAAVVAAAKAYHDKYATRGARMVGGDTGENPLYPWQVNPAAPYVLGEYDVDWSSAIVKHEVGRIWTDYEITKEIAFIQFPDTTDYYSGIELRSRFVSIQTPSEITQYIATYIPHEIYYNSYNTARLGGGRIGLRECNFSGHVLFTTLDGYHHSVYKVWQGEIVREVELYNGNIPMINRYEEFFDVMQGQLIGVCKLHSSSPEGGTITEIDGEQVVVIDPILIRPNVLTSGPIISLVGFSFLYTTKHPSIEDCSLFFKPGSGTSGGGGSSSNPDGDDDSDNDDESDYTPTLEEAKQDAENLFTNYQDLSNGEQQSIDSMILEILSDCMGRELLNQLQEANRDITFSFDPNIKASQHSYNGSSHSIIMKRHYSEVFLHELFHAYQTTTNTQGSANIEIEAQLARYVYMVNHEDPYILHRLEGYLKCDLGTGIAQLDDSINLPMSSQERESVIQNSIVKLTKILNNTIHNHNSNQSEQMTPLVLINQDSNKTFNNITELRKNC